MKKYLRTLYLLPLIMFAPASVFADETHETHLFDDLNANTVSDIAEDSSGAVQPVENPDQIDDYETAPTPEDAGDSGSEPTE